MSLYYVVFCLAVGLFTYLYWRSVNIRRKLWWVEAVPAYPLIGNANDFSDSTKSLNALQRYANKHNGLCYIELLLRPLIIITDYKLVEWLLSSNKVIEKGLDYQFLYNWLEEGMLISSGVRWKKARKILTPAFHFVILEQFVNVFEEPTLVLINVLEKEIDKDSVNIYPIISKYTLDVICQTSMGVRLNLQEGSHVDYQNAVSGMCNILIERAFNPLKMIDLFYYLSYDYFKEKKYVKLLHKVSNDVINRRLKQMENKIETEDDNDFGTKRKMAFLDLLLKYRDENGQPLPQDFIRQEVDTFMFAGHDTTASAISFAMYCIANHPEIQNEALKEINDILGGENKVTYRALQEMKYLECVVKETLRLYPSVPFYSRKTTEDVIYQDNKHIPKDVTLVVLAYAINRDPKIFDSPEEFNPSRWLNMDVKPYSYVPFSAGPRNCIGQKFAMLEMKNALTKILLNFELLPAVPQHKVVLAAEAVLVSKNGVNIKLKKRD